jgi:hypothetical protein
MAPKYLSDLTDARFSIAANDDVLAFVRRTNPSAHSDVGDVLFRLGKQIAGASVYCPSTASYAYVVLHTADDRIFAIAFGRRGLAFRLAVSSHADAIADGGVMIPDIGPDWVQFDPWGIRDRSAATQRLLRWATQAFTDAHEPG